MRKTAAGLILFTKDPHKGLIAILSRRGEFDYEKFRPEKYQNLYDVTAAGGIESGEHLIEGVMREVGEELGSATAKLIKHYASQFHVVAHAEHDYPNYAVTIYTYAVYIPHFPLPILKPHRSSAGLRSVTIKEMTHIKAFTRNDEKKGPAKDDPTVWMHSDQLEGLKKGFELFKHL